MPELKLGTKFDCYNCGTKFYDLGKADAVCPKCGANQKDSARAETPAVSQSSRRKRKAEVARPLDVEEEEEGPVEVLEDDEISAPEGVEADLDDDEEEEEEDFDGEA